MTLMMNDYKCNNCKSVFEYLVRGDDIPECPDCGTEDVKLCPSKPLTSKLNSKEDIKKSLQKRSYKDSMKNRSKNMERMRSKHPKMFK